METDLIKLGITYGEVALETTTPNMLKVVLKNNAKTAALGELLKDISKSAKGQKLKFNQLEIQDYLKSDKFTREEASMLTALRSRCVKGVRSDFKNMHKCVHCPLNCTNKDPLEYTHEHILMTCTKLRDSNMPLEFIHGSTATGVLLNMDPTLTEWPNMDRFLFFQLFLLPLKKSLLIQLKGKLQEFCKV